MVISSKYFWFLLLSILIGLILALNDNDQGQFPTSASIDNVSSLSVPILTILNDFLDFFKLYIKTESIALIKIDNISFESFGEETYQQQTVYLRSYYSNEPIQAIHNEKIYIFYLNITNLQISLINYKTNKQFSLNIDLAHSAENRWAPISFISSSHLPSITDIKDDLYQIKIVNNIRILTMNLWNFNYWLDRLDLIDTILLKYKPDIIGLQELRIRSKYFIENLYPNEDKNLLHSFQIYDMISSLKYFNNNSFGEFQWYSSPAMFFKESTPEQNPQHIVGEGLGIISRFPIIKKHKLKLSRDPNDGLDFHQRLLLGITIKINNDNNKLLDIYTTHLSLSENARLRTLPEIGTYINDQLNDNNKLGGILMGDFNCEFDYIDHEMDILSNKQFNLIDAWKVNGGCNDNDNHDNDDINNNMENKINYSYNYKYNKLLWNDEIDSFFTSPNIDYVKQRQEEEEEIISVAMDFEAWNKYIYQNENDKDDEWWRDDRCKNGWTFNTWDMKKRIDYFYLSKHLFYNNFKDIKIIGNDTFKVIPNLKPVGGVHDMFDKLYASDHRFIYLDIKI